MKTFKIADCIAQILLLMIAIAWFTKKHEYAWFGEIDSAMIIYLAIDFLPYYLVIGWQIISVSIHLANPQYNKKILRRIYLLLLFLFIARAIIFYFQKYAALYFLLMLPVSSVVLAIYYCIACLIETRAIKNKQPLTA
jgi:hypothetical protein